MPRTPLPLAVALPLAGSLLALGGCAAKPPAVDDTPLLRTAVVVTEVTNNGLKGQFANEGTRTVRTVPDARRTDDATRFTGSVMSRVGGKQDRSGIIRLEERLRWSLDNRKERYYECPLEGCESILTTFGADAFEGDGFEVDEDPELDERCDVRVVENDFVMDRTGERREINGFPADEHVASWTYSAKDGEGRLARQQIAMTVWTTPETGEIAEVAAMNEAFDAAYREAVAAEAPEALAALVPAAGLQVLLAQLLDGLDEEQRRALERQLANLTPIEGFPVSRKIQWEGKDETCAAPPEPEEQQARLDTGSFSGLLKSVGKQLVDQEIDKKKAEKARISGLTCSLTLHAAPPSSGSPSAMNRSRPSVASMPASVIVSRRTS